MAEFSSREDSREFFFLFLPTFTRASFLLCLQFSLFDSPVDSSRRKAKKRMYFSSIHCAVVMATIVLDNLLPLRTCSPLYQAILFLSSTNSFPASSLVMREVRASTIDGINFENLYRLTRPNKFKLL